MKSLFKEVLTKRASNAVAAGTTDVTVTIDRTGFDGIGFSVLFGAITSTAVTSCKLGVGSASDGSDAVDVSGVSATVADDDDNQIALLELAGIPDDKKYVTLTVDRGTANAVIDGVLVHLFNPRTLPVTQDTSSTVVGLAGAYTE